MARHPSCGAAGLFQEARSVEMEVALTCGETVDKLLLTA